MKAIKATEAASIVGGVSKNHCVTQYQLVSIDGSTQVQDECMAVTRCASDNKYGVPIITAEPALNSMCITGGGSN